MQLGELASTGDTNALKAFDQYGRLLAGAFANIAALFCPEKIKFGGGLSELAVYYTSAMKKNLIKLFFQHIKAG